MSVPPGVQERRQKNLVLILAREFSSKLATASFVADAEGTLVYYNEPAEALLGRSFAETGEVRIKELADLYALEEDDGSPMPMERRPAHTALVERRPVHRDLSFTSLDGVKRRISATAFPLFSRPNELVGIMSIFWERESR